MQRVFWFLCRFRYITGYHGEIVTFSAGHAAGNAVKSVIAISL